MLLALDIGNTQIVVGIYQNKQLFAAWRMATSVQRTADEYAVILSEFLVQKGLAPANIRGIVIGCVMPPLLTTFEDLCRRHLGREPLVVGPGIKTGLRIRTDDPREVGADRVANALAAKTLYGTPAIVIDFGTATALDAVDANGDYLGNAIAPGLAIAAEALFSRTAQLRRIELHAPGTAIGKNTVAAMQSGVVYGHVGLVEGLVERFQKELGGRAKVIATGDSAELIAKETRVIEIVDPHLTLQGLRLIYEVNVV